MKLRSAIKTDPLAHERHRQPRDAERVTVALDDGVLGAPLHSDPLLLRTVLSNLVDNALKYSPPGAAVQVTAALSPKGERIGVGIRVENAPGRAGMPQAERAFEKFYRAPGAHQQSGSGLGLYIAKALAGQLGGILDYCPNPPTNRVIFELWLPL